MAGWENQSRFKFFCVITVVSLVARAAGRWSSDRAWQREMTPEYLERVAMSFGKVKKEAKESY